MSKANEPAFPGCSEKLTLGELDYSVKWQGLSKRELFAAMALMGFSSRKYYSPESAATSAVEAADILLAELERQS